MQKQEVSGWASKDKPGKLDTLLTHEVHVLGGSVNVGNLSRGPALAPEENLRSAASPEELIWLRERAAWLERLLAGGLSGFAGTFYEGPATGWDIDEDDRLDSCRIVAEMELHRVRQRLRES